MTDGRRERHRFYCSAAWRKLRALQLRTEPICRACKAEGRVVPADTADHVEPISRGGDLFGPLQSLCRTHHQEKTNAEQHGRPAPVPGTRGCNRDGFPNDPNHPWRKE